MRSVNSSTCLICKLCVERFGTLGLRYWIVTRNSTRFLTIVTTVEARCIWRIIVAHQTIWADGSYRFWYLIILFLAEVTSLSCDSALYELQIKERKTELERLNKYYDRYREKMIQHKQHVTEFEDNLPHNQKLKLLLFKKQQLTEQGTVRFIIAT